LIEIHHKESTAQFGDSDLPLTIGSTTGAHVFLPEAIAVEGYIGDSKGHLFLQPVETSSPFYHNGQHVEASTWIKSGDTTRIGSILLHYIISGDLVEIHVAGVDDKEVLIPPGSPHPDTGEDNEPLPRTSKDVDAGGRRKKISLLLIGFFLFLLLAVSFVLTARSLEVTISPEPDTLSISGFPPVIKFGTHFLGLTGEYTARVPLPLRSCPAGLILLQPRLKEPRSLLMDKTSVQHHCMMCRLQQVNITFALPGSGILSRSRRWR
jgi:hypothetical protein